MNYDLECSECWKVNVSITRNLPCGLTMYLIYYLGVLDQDKKCTAMVKEIIFAGYLAKVIIVSFSLGNTLKLFDCRMTA